MPAVLIVLGLFAGLFGFSMLIPAWNARKRDQIRQSWPTAKGTVMSTEVLRQSQVSAKQEKLKDLFDVVVKYQFRSGGQLHFGSAVSFPRFLYENEEDAKQVVERYPVGTKATVHYNSEDPVECCLELKESSASKYYRISIGVIVLAVIMVCLSLALGLGGTGTESF